VITDAASWKTLSSARSDSDALVVTLAFTLMFVPLRMMRLGAEAGLTCRVMATSAVTTPLAGSTRRTLSARLPTT